jgi:hypothetical protein
MLRVWSSLASLFALFTLAISQNVSAQALPAASREPVEVGAAFSFGSPSYNDTPTYVEGLTVFGDLGFTRRIAAEFDLHFDSLLTPEDIGEDSYLIGPRFSVLREDRANVYLKALGGIGRFSYQSGSYANPHTDTYGVVAFGAGIEFRVSRRFNVRAIDLEYQVWPGFAPGTLHPVVASTGIAYSF